MDDDTGGPRPGSFRGYAAATLVSDGGTAISMIALPILVYHLTSSPLWTATVGVATAVPYLVLGLIAGAAADRYPRGRIMILADLVSGAAMASIPIAYWAGHLTAPHVVVAALVSQTGFVFYDAANFGFLVSLVGRDGILAANSFLYSASSVMEAAAPAAVGVALGVVAVPNFILVDAVSFLIAAGLIVRLARRSGPEPVSAAAGQSWRSVVVEGLRFFRHNGVVTRMTLVSALMTAGNGGVLSVLVVWVTRTFGMSTTDHRIGVFYVAIAVAGIAAAGVADRVGRTWSPETGMKVFILLSVVTGYAMLLTHIWWVGAVLAGVSGGASFCSVIFAVATRQRAIPDALQSRVNTLGRMLAFGLGFSVGAILAGGLGAALPIRVTLALVYLLRLAAAMVTWLFPVRVAEIKPDTGFDDELDPSVAFE